MVIPLHWYLSLMTSTTLAKLGKGRPWCDHCHKLGHTIDKFYALHCWPHWLAIVDVT